VIDKLIYIYSKTYARKIRREITLMNSVADITFDEDIVTGRKPHKRKHLNSALGARKKPTDLRNDKDKLTKIDACLLNFIATMTVLTDTTHHQLISGKSVSLITEHSKHRHRPG